MRSLLGGLVLRPTRMSRGPLTQHVMTSARRASSPTSLLAPLLFAQSPRMQAEKPTGTSWKNDITALAITS